MVAIDASHVSSKTELKQLEKHKNKSKVGGFESLGLNPDVHRGIKRKGYKLPTPIQRKNHAPHSIWLWRRRHGWHQLQQNRHLLRPMVNFI